MAYDADRLGTEPVAPLLWHLSLPAIVSMAVLASYNAVDAAFVGRATGAAGLAGVAMTYAVYFFCLALGLLAGVGAASVISRALGSGDREKARRTFANALGLGLGLNLVLMVLTGSFMEPLLTLLGAAGEARPHARAYLEVLIWYFPLLALGAVGNNVLRAEGRARAAMGSSLVGAVVNTVLDAWFLFGLGMGVRGAAIATVIAQGVVVLWVAWQFRPGRSALELRWRDFRPRWDLLREIAAVGTADSARLMAGCVVVVVLNHCLVRFGGPSFVAIYGIMERLGSLMALPVMGVAQGLQPLVGYSYGAGRFDRLHQAVRLAVCWATAFALVGFALMVFFPEFLVGLFTTDEGLLASGVLAFRTGVWFFWGVGFLMCTATVLTALGEARWAFFLSMVRQVGVLLLVPILPLFWGIRGVWLSFTMAEAVALVASIWLFRRQMRRLAEEGRRRTLQEEAPGAPVPETR